MGQTITIHDLQILDEAPRIQDLKLATALGFDRPRDIRKLVERNLEEIRRHGEIISKEPGTVEEAEKPPHGEAVIAPLFGEPRHRGAVSTGRRGPIGRVYWLNEPQALVVCMLSRTDKAAEVRHMVITVFMAWRRGQMPIAAPAKTVTPADRFEQPLAERREARRLAEAAFVIYGRGAAQRQWVAGGLPALFADDDMTADRGEELAQEALRLILDAEIDGEPARAWVERAILLDPVAHDVVRKHGMMVIDAEAGLVIGRSAEFIVKALYAHPLGAGSLTDLVGAREYKVTKFNGKASRASFIPYSTLDTELRGEA